MSQKELTYKSIEKEILKRITTGVYRPGQKLPPERQLEKEFAVSRLTIAKGLSNLTSAGYITRTRGRGSFVCESIPSLRRDDSRPANIKGIIKYISPPANANEPISVSHGIMEGLHNVLTPAGYHIGVDFYNTLEQQLNLLAKFADPLHEAFVVWPALDPRVVSELHKMRAKGFPFVLVDAYFPEIECDYIISNNSRGAETMIGYLAENGHKRISYFTASPDRISLSERLSGVISGLSRYGLDIGPDTINIIPCQDLIVSGFRSSQNIVFLQERITALMRSPNRPTAIFCSNDWIAMSVYNILEDLGIKVPQDVSLAGFDNVDVSQFFKIPLTTVSQDFYEIGRLAAKVILGRKQQNAYGDMACQLRVEPQLVIRDSVYKLI